MSQKILEDLYQNKEIEKGGSLRREQQPSAVSAEHSKIKSNKGDGTREGARTIKHYFMDQQPLRERSTGLSSIALKKDLRKKANGSGSLGDKVIQLFNAATYWKKRKKDRTKPPENNKKPRDDKQDDTLPTLQET